MPPRVGFRGLRNRSLEILFHLALEVLSGPQDSWGEPTRINWGVGGKWGYLSFVRRGGNSNFGSWIFLYCKSVDRRFRVPHRRRWYNS